MGDFQASTTANAGEHELFDYLSQVANLPRYFPRMTTASPSDGEEVHTTATMPDGLHVSGDAWFQVDDPARRIEWGSKGAHDHHGPVDIHPAGTRTAVAVRLHTTRVTDGDPDVQAELEDTVATIGRLVEDQHAIRRAK